MIIETLFLIRGRVLCLSGNKSNITYESSSASGENTYPPGESGERERAQEMREETGKTALLLVAPETSRLPERMGPLARYISGASGGLGEVIATLCYGLTQRGIETHLALPYLKRRFQQECNLDDNSWYSIRHRVDPAMIHLVNSSIYQSYASMYEGDPRQNAAEFQKQIINHIIPAVRATYGGRLIMHSHDWMAGGIITAYAKLRDCPVLHTVHNIHTGLIPPDMFFGVDMEPLTSHLYFIDKNGRRCIDCQATAIKNANLVSFVGKRFLQEIMEGLLGSEIITPHIRREITIKHADGNTLTILNAPSPVLYPEHCSYLAVPFGPDDDILAAKRENLVEFQKRTGLQVNPEAILLYWPSRLDPMQKGIHLLEDIAHRFVIDHGDAQIAIVGDGVGNDRTHEEICGRIAWSSGGKIVYHRFSEPLSMLGFAAASDVFGASLYEPCGQIDQIGNLYGATATNRDTGGYHDKIQELTLTAMVPLKIPATVFCSGTTTLAASGTVCTGASNFTAVPPRCGNRNLRRIMRETRLKHSIDRMVDDYIAVYERLNGGVPLA